MLFENGIEVEPIVCLQWEYSLRGDNQKQAAAREEKENGYSVGYEEHCED